MIRVGTRGSALALAQAGWVADRLGAEYELVTISGAGPVDDKSRWVSELERALLAGEIDVAVHSAKDVPAELPDGLELVAVPARADARDAICGSASLTELSSGARVGTSSVRRTAQLRAIRADLNVVPMHGNVDTRLRKLARGDCDALVLALAGLERLGLREEADGFLDELVPAPGQGALLLEARPGRLPAECLAGLSDPETTVCVGAEREVVRGLEASCHTPLGVHGRMAHGRLELAAWLGLPDGSHWISDLVCGDARTVPGELVARLETVGARELLRSAEAAA